MLATFIQAEASSFFLSQSHLVNTKPSQQIDSGSLRIDYKIAQTPEIVVKLNQQ